MIRLKKGVIFAALTLLACFGIYAQMPKGLNVGVDVEVKAFQMERIDKSDAELRKQAGENVGQKLSWPFSGFEWFGGTGYSFSYDAEYFGASLGFGFGEEILDDGRRKQTYNEKLKEWFPIIHMSIHNANAWAAPFGQWIKITAGFGIGSGYVDGMGGDEMRVYTGTKRDNWDDKRNPDNIVQNEGVLLESFTGPLNIALAGHYFKSSLFTKSVNPHDPVLELQNTKYLSMEQRTYSYGARISSEIANLANLSVSYVQDYSNDSGNNYSENLAKNKLVPITGDAEFRRHLFGAYATLVPFEGFGFTLGYSGIVTQYVNEIYSQSLYQMIPVTFPVVFQQGINLNMRYTGVDRWTFRTDCNVTFWHDKNYLIYNFGSSMGDIGIAGQTALTRAYPEVNHFFVYNGLGAEYRINEKWTAGLSGWNLYRRDSALDDKNNTEYRFTRDKIYGELRGKWRPRGKDNLEFYASLAFENTVTLISKDTYAKVIGNKDGFGSLAHVRDTADTELNFRIPIGMTIRMY